MRASYVWLIQLAVVANLMMATLCCVDLGGKSGAEAASLAGAEICRVAPPGAADGPGHDKRDVHAHCFLCTAHGAGVPPHAETVAALLTPELSLTLRWDSDTGPQPPAALERTNLSRAPPIHA